MQPLCSSPMDANLCACCLCLEKKQKKHCRKKQVTRELSRKGRTYVPRHSGRLLTVRGKTWLDCRAGMAGSGWVRLIYLETREAKCRFLCSAVSGPAKGRHGDQTNWLIQLTGLYRHGCKHPGKTRRLQEAKEGRRK